MRLVPQVWEKNAVGFLCCFLFVYLGFVCLVFRFFLVYFSHSSM